MELKLNKQLILHSDPILNSIDPTMNIKSTLSPMLTANRMISVTSTSDRMGLTTHEKLASKYCKQLCISKDWADSQHITVL